MEAGLKLKRRKPVSTPASVAAMTAASGRLSASATRKSVTDAISPVPAASPSRPSMRLKALVMPTIHSTVSTRAERRQRERAAGERVGHGSEAVPALQGDQRGERLQRRAWERAHAAHVVGDAEPQHEHRADREPAQVPAGGLEQIDDADAEPLRDRERPGAGDQQRDATEARHASAVHPPPTAAIDHVELQRRRAHRRCDDDRQRGGGHEQGCEPDSHTGLSIADRPRRAMPAGHRRSGACAPTPFPDHVPDGAQCGAP